MPTFTFEADVTEEEYHFWSMMPPAERRKRISLMASYLAECMMDDFFPDDDETLIPAEVVFEEIRKHYGWTEPVESSVESSQERK